MINFDERAPGMGSAGSGPCPSQANASVRVWNSRVFGYGAKLIHLVLKSAQYAAPSLTGDPPMALKKILIATAFVLSASAGQAEDSAIVLGKSAYGALCAVCHGVDGKGGGQIAELFEVEPPNLTKLSERADGRFPFADAYQTIVLGMEAPGHGPSEMPVWGDYFMADALEDRGVNATDAIFIASGRAFALTIYLESIQE
ncbi:c-type cytochrome [Roseivivax sp. CAU 1753]